MMNRSGFKPSATATALITGMITGAALATTFFLILGVAIGELP